MAKIVLLCLISLLVCATGQRITTINLDGVQYFVSRMNPYSPELNYFLAYQYCRSLGLQLAAFETKEKSESIILYLKNAGFAGFDFWTSGNRLGTDMFIWQSTGLPFNTTFDFFENSSDVVQSGLLNTADHNSNTSPQRTARDSSSGAKKDCVMLKKPNLQWMPEDCSVVKDFICEQTRCYYYNYGSIPVSSAQGRPITTTTHRSSAAMAFLTSTTPLPSIMSTYASFAKKNQPEPEPEPSFASLKLDHERALEAEQDDNKSDNEESIDVAEHHVINNDENNDDGAADSDSDSVGGDDNNDGDDVERTHELNQVKKQIIKLAKDEIEREHDEESDDHQQHQHQHEDDEKFPELEKDGETDGTGENTDVHLDDVIGGEDGADDVGAALNEEDQENLSIHRSSGADSEIQPETDDNLTRNASEINENKQQQHDDIPSVEMRLKQISQEIEKIASGESHVDNHQRHHITSDNNGDGDDLGRQSFLSLTDLIRTLRPNDKQIPQIDSDYSNAMRVLGETSSLVGNDESRKYKETDSGQQHQLNRALF